MDKEYYEEAILRLKEFQKKEKERTKNMQPCEVLYERIMDAMEEFKEACQPKIKD